MDILSKLPFLKDDEVVDQPELTEEEAKAERIAFHRTNVRNGPVKFKGVTSGQERRRRQRWLDSRTRKARRAQIRLYFAQQQEAAVLRGHLQAAGVQAYANEHLVARPDRALASIVWIVRHFAEVEEGDTVEVTAEVVTQSLTSALNRWQTLVGLPTTPLSPAYVLPVALSA